MGPGEKKSGAELFTVFYCILIAAPKFCVIIPHDIYGLSVLQSTITPFIPQWVTD